MYLFNSFENIKSFHLQPTNDGQKIRIYGIKHHDYNLQHPSNVTILEGGPGGQFVKIKVEPSNGLGVNSTFMFYTSDMYYVNPIRDN